MIRPRVLLLTVFLAATPIGFAPAAGAAEPDDATLAEARRLIEITDVAKLVAPMIDTMMSNLTALMVQLNPEQGQLAKDLMDQYLTPELRRRIPEMLDASAGAYARHFTLEELQQITAFYETPVGRKVVSAMPALMSEMMALGEAWGEQVAVESFRELIPLMKERGLKTPDI